MPEDRRTTRQRRGDRPSPETSAVPTEPVAVPRSAPPATPRAQRTPPMDLNELEAIASLSPEELAALMEGGAMSAVSEIGDRVSGTVTHRGRERCLIDIGAKAEAEIATSDVGDAQIGDTVEAYVISQSDGDIFLSTTAQGAAADAILATAAADKTPLEGVVSGRNPGGYDVKFGSVRAFCPASQMDRLPATDPDVYIGQTFPFLVLESGDNTVVSRRALQEELAKAGYDAFWASVAVGDEHDGVVTNVTSFGVFVDVGGVEGLVHKSQLGWGDVDPQATVKRGQRMTVRVTEIRADEGKLGLSAKDPGENPWTTLLGATFQQGGTYAGPVVRLEDYGAFVELAPGLQGLLHISRSGGTLPALGDTVDVRIDRIDLERQRLELAGAGTPTVADNPAGADVSGVVRDVLRNGVVVDLEDGRSGWLPAKNVDLPAGNILAQRFRPGHTITARIDADGDGRRVVLTQRSQDSGAWRGQATTQGGSFGTLGDLLNSLKS